MNLAEINEKLESQLKSIFGIEIDRLPKFTQNILDELIEFQVATNLCDVDSTLTREWYNVKRREHLDLRLKCLPIKTDVEQVKNLIVSEEKLLLAYEKVLDENKDLITDLAASEAEVNKIEKQVQADKENNSKMLSTKYEVNLKQLIEKMEMLEKNLNG